MAAQRDLDKNRINRPPTTVEPQQSCNYRYVLPESLVYRMIPATGTEVMISPPTSQVVALNSYEAAQLRDGIRLADYYSKRPQMPMAYAT
uniref:Uncharacterized protein n=1 Tax=Solanum lycopersicum TaxID=4081 RepID=A0A3Q7EZ27_SOLLC